MLLICHDLLFSNSGFLRMDTYASPGIPAFAKIARSLDCPAEGSDEVLCPAPGNIDLIAGVDSENVLDISITEGWLLVRFLLLSSSPARAPWTGSCLLDSPESLGFTAQAPSAASH